MEMDINNPVMKLCADGMQAALEGRTDDARDLFTRAWELSTDDYDASLAAHFLARHQSTPEDRLKWDRESLNRANAAVDDRLRGFYPSLYLHLGHSFEILDDWAEAKRYYELAAEKSVDIPEGRYGDVLHNGIARARQRIESHENDGKGDM